MTNSENAIRAGNQNDTLGHNDCGYPTGTFHVSAPIQGDTGMYANVDSNAHCTSKFPDGQNTVSWGPLAGTGYLAWSCQHADGAGRMNEGDIYFASDQDIKATLPSPCSYNFDLQDIATHEWGHVLGLDDVYNTNQKYLTMFWSSAGHQCQTWKRTLGNGDWHGLNVLYANP